MRNIRDDRWLARHSEQARLDEEMKWWNRTGSVPSSWLGFRRAVVWGKRPEFERLLAAAQFEGCRDCSGIDLGLSSISNHSFRTDEEWREWYDTHKSLTQEEWIREGFASAGVQVSIPPLKSEVDPMLALMGKRDEPALNQKLVMKRKHSHPSWLTFNAYRWLSDSGFDPVDYLIEHRSASLSEDLIEGIKFFQEYKLWYAHPGERQKLSFAEPAVNVWDLGLPHITPAFTTLGYRCAVYGLMLAFWGGGFRLLRRGLNARRLKSAPASPTSHPPGTADDPRDHQ